MIRMNRFVILICLVFAFGMVGCNEPQVPVNPKAPAGTNPYVSGSPQERIQNIQNDPTLTAQEKEFRIKAIKERNNLQ